MHSFSPFLARRFGPPGRPGLGESLYRKAGCSSSDRVTFTGHDKASITTRSVTQTGSSAMRVIFTIFFTIRIVLFTRRSQLILPASAGDGEALSTLKHRVDEARKRIVGIVLTDM